MKRLLTAALRWFGLELRRLPRVLPEDDFPSIADLSPLSRIPGMISPDRCEMHYLLAATQTISGDIVEIGSWQGRNTCYLAAACRDSHNGVVHAIDHFKGNPGKERLYRVGQADLSDLEGSFRTNVEKANLSGWVRLHPVDAAEVAVEGPIRMLFIDGEHTYKAVSSDLDRFAHLVPRGGLVIFDDYNSGFPGVVEAAREWAGTRTAITMANSLLVVV